MVADEPLVGLDRDRAVGVVAAVDQRRAQPLLVAAVGDLADELVDEVAAVGEDQDAAGAGGVDEADRGDGLAGAGRVLEPEAALGAGVLGRLLDRLLLLLGLGSSQSWGSSSGGELLVLVAPRVVGASSPSARLAPSAASAALAVAAVAARRRCGATCCSAISSVRVPERASTWCGLSSAPSRSFGGSSASRRSSPSSSEKSRRHSIEGFSAPRRARQRGVERPAARGPGRQRLGALAVEQERLAGERRRPLDIGA